MDQPRSYLRQTGLQIRAAIYRAFPHTPTAELDGMELWQLGVRLGNDMGRPLSETERAEAEALKATQSARLREVAERRKARAVDSPRG